MNITTGKNPAFLYAGAATFLFIARRQSMIPERVGQAFTCLFARRMSPIEKTMGYLQREPKFIAADAMGT
jgi:hypothetical protein